MAVKIIGVNQLNKKILWVTCFDCEITFRVSRYKKTISCPDCGQTVTMQEAKTKNIKRYAPPEAYWVV